jgi:hypothetical protein
MPGFTIDDLSDRQKSVLAAMARHNLNYRAGCNGAISVYHERLNWNTIKGLARRHIIWITWPENTEVEVMIRQEYLPLAEECRKLVEHE